MESSGSTWKDADFLSFLLPTSFQWMWVFLWFMRRCSPGEHNVHGVNIALGELSFRYLYALLCFYFPLFRFPENFSPFWGERMDARIFGKHWQDA